MAASSSRTTAEATEGGNITDIQKKKHQAESVFARVKNISSLKTFPPGIFTIQASNYPAVIKENVTLA